MKKMNIKRLSAFLVCIAALVVALVVTVFAGSETTKEDATTAIKAAFADKQIGETQKLDKDGYIGIPIEVTTYYDYATHGAAKPGYNGTIAVMYVVNTGVERVGTKSDVEIIGSMLERGYVVSVFDYMNNKKAVSPGLDWSTQTVRKDYLAGSFFTDKTKLPSGTYQDNFVVPAGYDLSYGNVFWEADKHASDGSLEKIVENWNTDLKNWNNIENKIVYWRNALGEQKKTEGAVEWFSDAAGKNAVAADASNANYTKVKYTVAEDVTDCVGPDGTPIDLNLYMHIVYPTNPENAVPVAVLASSTEYLNTASTGSGLRPQHNGFLFNGYAGATFDYLYQPMAQKDYWGYYDGQTSLGAITGDRMNYGLHLYSDKKINTAAMRYLRYLTYTNNETFKFDDESIGVFGNSKGGWFTFLGEAEVREYTVEDASLYTKAELEELINDRINAYTSKRQFQGHRDETRYDNGITEAYTKNGVTIDGGELQPWLTYTDKDGVVHEILGYASWIYASNGSQYEDITEGHAPVFSALHLQDDFTTTHNLFSEVTKGLDIPSMYVIVDLGHTFAYGPDYYHGYDTYQAMFDFANYYLKHDAVKVIYTDPVDKTGAMSTTAPITIKFSGAVPASEIEKVTLSAGGVNVKGTWTSVRGNTEWTFEHEALLPGTAYTLTVPASIAGDNGKAMGADYTATYYTESEGVYAVTKTNGSAGAYFTVTVPNSPSSSDARIRFYVSNDAANVADLHVVNNFDASNPGASTIGNLVSTVSLNGAGYYEVDVTDYVLEKTAGSTVTFLLSVKKTAAETTKTISFASSLSSVTLGSYVRGSVANAPDGTSSAKVYVTANIRANGSMQYPNELPFYANATTAITAKNILGANVSASDLGRQFRITIRLYDTDTRIVQLGLNRVSGDMVHDKHTASYNFMTEAGKWQEFSFDYTVYESMYGDFGLVAKNLTVMLGSTGKDESPIYIESITITETVTDVNLDSASLVLGERGDAYKKNETSGDAFKVGSNSYATLKGAVLGAQSGDTIVLRRNYTLTSADDTTAWGTVGNITLDLNGYNLYSESSLPVVHVSATSTAKANITVKGGSIYLSDGALIGYSGSTSAGNGKNIEVTLENLNVLNAQGAKVTDFISESSIESASGANVKINLNGVNIDYRKAYNAKIPVKLLSNGSATLDVQYVLKGGEITLDGISGVAVYDTFKKTYIEADADGNYTTINLPEGIEISVMPISIGNGVMAFTFDNAQKGISTYVAKENAYVTKYGIIPEEYADADFYPFVLFDENGNFKGAYAQWLGLSGSGGVITAARNYVVNAWNGTTYGANPKEAFIVMRRNYTYASAEGYDNLAQTQGTINIDLGGYTLSTSTYAKPILQADSKGYSGAAGQKVFPTTINFFNGKLMHGKSGIVTMKTWDSVGDGSIVNKNFNFSFTNVTFGFVEGADSVGLLAHSLNPTTKTYAAPFNFTFNDCTFDLRTTKSMYSNATIFNTNTSGKYIKATYYVNGGKLITDNPAGITLVSSATDNYGSSVTFGKGSDGNYLSYQIPTSAAAPTGTYKAETAKLGFEATATVGTDTIYTLVETSSSAFYDAIPSTYADTTKYPFAIFDKNGVFLSAKANWKEALSSAKTHVMSNVWDPVNKTYGNDPYKAYILVRADYTTTSTDNSFQDIAQIQGEVVIDMNGHTITQGSTDTYGIFGRTKSKGWSSSGDEKIFYSTVTVINGSFKVLNKALFGLGTWETVGNGTIAGKVFTFNFNNVNIGYASGATSTNLLFRYESASASSGCTLSKAAPFFMNFEDCTFDVKTNAPSGAKLFNAAPADGQWISNTVTVKGGNIIAKSMTLANLLATESVYGSSVTFAKNSEGNYTTLQLDSTGTAPTEDIPNDSGKVMQFAKESSTLYSLSTLITKYGVIPEKYASVDAYPYAVFRNGQFVFASNIFGKNGADSALHKAKADGSVVLFRRNVDYTETRYNNLSQTTGTVTIDLNGFTVSLKQTGATPWIYAQKKTQYDSTVIVINGTVLTGSNEIVRFDSWDGNGNYTGGCNFNVIFDGVTIGVLSGHSPAAIFKTVENQTNAVETNANLTIKNSVIDLSNSPKTTLFMIDDESGLIDTVVNVESTVIKGNDISEVIFVPALDNTSSSVTFATDVVVHVKSGKVNAGVVNTTVGEMIFVEMAAKENGYTVYKLADANVSNYLPKMSITLSNELVMNAYIPVNSTLKFTFNGVTYENLAEFGGEIRTLSDGNAYYFVSAPLGSSEAAKIVKLEAVVKNGEDNASVTFTFTIPAYATKVLNNDAATDAEKTLAKDVLAYIKEAYLYFGEAHNTAAEIERVVALVDSIIGDYTGEPVLSGTTNTVAPVTAVTLNLDAKPTIRFYVTDANVEFYANGKKLNTVSGTDATGTYVELDVYAYALSETITYGDGGSYHVSSFVTGAMGTDHETLVKAFVKYTESAAAYRNSVAKK